MLYTINEMEKVCVFCGGKLESKTLEHVLPQWLIELTGNPKRMARFGYDHSKNERVVERKFSFDAFKFPACKSCNQSFAKLEASVKAIVRKVLSNDLLSESELNTLLDWFDKIRIGLWLGYQYLDKNPLKITPHFHIEKRIGQHDRMLAIFKADGNQEGLSFFGCETPIFAHTPSCFSLRINNIYFFNVSYPGLLARRMGFPFPFETYAVDDGREFYRFTWGRNRIIKPILKKLISIEGTELYQPMFAAFIPFKGQGDIKELYDVEYVRNNCISWGRGIGRIFVKNKFGVNVYSNCPSREWLPERTYNLKELRFGISSLTFEWQLYLMDKLGPSVKMLSREGKRQISKLHALSRDYNKAAIKFVNRQRGISDVQ